MSDTDSLAGGESNQDTTSIPKGRSRTPSRRCATGGTDQEFGVTGKRCDEEVR